MILASEGIFLSLFWALPSYAHSIQVPGIRPYQWADLHPHTIDLSFEAAGLCIVAAIFLTPQPATWRQRLPLLAVGTLLLGAMGVINTWDFPSYLILFTAAFFISEQQRLQHLYKLAWRKKIAISQVVRLVGVCAGMGIASIALYLPLLKSTIMRTLRTLVYPLPDGCSRQQRQDWTRLRRA